MGYHVEYITRMGYHLGENRRKKSENRQKIGKHEGGKTADGVSCA